MRLPGGDLPARLADRLHALDYTVEGVRCFLGPVASEALNREETVPAVRVVRDDPSPVSTAIELLLLGETVPEREVASALGIEPAELGDLLESSGGHVRSVVELAPYAVDDRDWLVAADWSARRTGTRTGADHVLGVGGASTMLAQCTVRPQVERALDLGTGCGVQAFHLFGHSDEVIGTDISDRCLRLATFNGAMNHIPFEVRRGSLFGPVAGERFDLVVSNPPFVIGAPGQARRDYRDSGLAGDAVCAAVVKGAADHLVDGGWCQLLANWEITDGDDWSAHPRGWVTESGLDAWVIQRDVQDPAAYIEMWLRDAGERSSPGYRALYDAWMSTLARRGVLGIGFGLVNVRRTERDLPIQRFQHAPQEWVQPVASDVERWFSVQEVLSSNPAGLLTQRLRVNPDVGVEEHRGIADLEAVALLRRSTGMGWSGPVDAFGLGLLAALDGIQTAGEAVLSVAAEHEVEPAEALGAAVPVLGQLALEGFVL